jgi:3',5'-cyclic AMP phosphodiesterase CpdA
MGTSVFVIPGNHDILNPWAREIKGEEQLVTERIDANDFESIYKEFGYEEAISKDKSTLSYLAAPADNLYLLMLDTCIYDFNDLVGMPTTNGEIASETFEWIKQCSKLAQDNNAQVVTVMHHNLLNHSDVLYSGFTLDNSEEALAVLQECGLNLVLSGHLHIQDIKSSFEEQNQVFDIATSSLSVYPVQYGVLKFTPSEGFDYSTSRVDVEGWAKESGNRDANIMNFKEYSKEYFANISSKKTYDNLTAGGSYTKEEIEQMTDTMGLLNINYFAGTISKVKKEVMESRGYQLLTDTAETEFLKAYILSMLSDDKIDDNKLHIPLQEGK